MKKALCFLVFFVFSALCLADVTYTSLTKSWSDKSKTPTVVNMKTFVKAPSFFRTEFDTADNPVMNKDSYWISKDGVNIFIINKKEKSYKKITMDDIAKLSSAMLQIMQITIENPSVKQVRGDQDMTVAGLSAQHYVQTSDYISKMKMAFIKSTSTVHSVKNIWIAPSFTEGIKDAGAGQNVKTGYPDLDKLIDAEMIKVPGMIVKSSTITENKNEKGDVEKSYSDYSVTTIVKGDVDPSLFEIPAGYQEVKQEQSQNGQKYDSGTNRNNSSNPMDKLKGMFGN